MSGNVQSTNIEYRAGASETVMTMQSDTPNGSKRQSIETHVPRYDRSEKAVFGDGYCIKYTGQMVLDQIHTIFFYQDRNISFNFKAERKKWLITPGSKKPSDVIDTEIYTIVGLWYEETNWVRKKNIPKDHKEIAKANILQGMKLMEEECNTPPKAVIIKWE